MKSGGPLGLSIVGGSDHASHPFGVNEPGVFISKVKLVKFPFSQFCLFAPAKISHVSLPGDSSRPRVPKRTTRRGPNIRGERHRPASRHTPGSRASPAGQQAGDPYAGTEGPFTAWDAGEAVDSNKRLLMQENAHFALPDEQRVSLQDIMIQKQPGEKLGISIRGGAKGHAGNPFDATDEGIFISKVQIYFIPHLCNPNIFVN